MQQNVPGITSSTAETLPLPQRGRQETTPTVRLTRLADGTIAVTTDKGVVATRQTIKLDDLSPEMQKPYAVAVTMKDADGNIDIDKANAYLAGYDRSPVNEYTAKFEKEYEGNSEFGIRNSEANMSEETGVRNEELNSENSPYEVNDTENSPSGVNENVDSVNETVNVNNEKAPGAERARRRNTGRDLRRAQIIKRKDGTFTDKSGTLTDDQVHFLTAVADTYRLDLNVLNDLDGGAWGEYVEILNKINLSAKSDLLSSFLHETGHLIKLWAPEKWEKIEAGFKDYMIAKYGMQRLSYLMDDAIDRYSGKISDGAALTEVVCDHLEAIRNTKTFAEDFAKVLGEKGYSQSKIKQVFKDISDFFRRMADVIRGWMNGGAQTKAGIFASQDAEYCEKLAADWLDAMESVRVNYAQYADNANSEFGVRSSEADTGVKKMNAPEKEKTIDTIRSIGKKSINALSSSELQLVSDFAIRMKDTMTDSAKSPFFRAWFGDWRAHDISPVSYVEIETGRKVKPSDVPRTGAINNDTGWNIRVNTVSIDETNKTNGKNSLAHDSLARVNQMIEKAVLIDTVIFDTPSKKAGANSLFMHHFYCPIKNNGETYLAKLYVIESVDADRKFYLTKIEEATFGSKVAGNYAAAYPKVTSSEISVAQIFDFVKNNYRLFNSDDSEYVFAPKEVSPALLNADGTPKVVYHGSDKNFTTFKSADGTYWFSENEDYAEAMAEERTGKYGGGIVKEFYLRMENPYKAKLAPGKFSDPNFEKPIIDYAKKNGYDGVIIENDTSDEIAKETFYVVFEPTQIKSSTDNIGTYDAGNEDTLYMRPQEQSEVDELRSQLETERAERADYEKKTKAVIREQKKMIQMLKESAATGGKHIVSFESTQDVIRRLNSQYGTRLSLSDDASELTKLYSKIANVGNASSDDVIGLLRGFAKKIIDNSYHKDTSFRDEHKAILKDWRENPIRLNRDQVSVLEHKYGSWTEARKHFFGKINFSQTNGTYLDDNFREWLNEYPELFPGYDENLTAGDQPLALLNAYDLTRPERVSELMDGFGGNTDLAETYIANQLFDEYWKTDEVKTVSKAASEARAVAEREYSKALDEYKSAAEKEIKRLSATALETEKDFAKYRDREEKKKLRNKIKDQMNWFKKRAVNPSSTAFVPAPLYDSLIDVCQALDFSHNIDPDSDAGKKVAVLKQKYDLLAQYKKNPHEYARIYGVSADKIYDLSNAFDEEISEELEMLSRLLNGGVDDEGNFTAPIAVMDMNNEQLSEAAELLERMKNTFDDYAYVIGEEVRITYASMRDKFYWQQKQFMNSPLRMRGFFENLTSPMRAIAELEGHNPDGVMTKLFKALEQGEFKQMKTYMEIMKPFDELMADKKAFKKYSTKLVDSGLVDDKNKPIMLTHDDIVTIIMTYERERQSGFFTKHLQESGITVYDRDFVKKGNIEKAAEKSQRMRHVTSFDVLKLTDLLTDYDRKWMAAAENFFNKQSAKILDEVVFMLKHKHMIPTKYYIPFIVDKNYLVGDIEALKFDSRMSKAGYLEEVQHGANNPLIITGLSEVVKRHAESVSNQAGYAVPLYNLNRFYESPVRDDSVKFIVEKAFGKRGHGKGTSNIIEQVSADVQKPRIKSDKMRSDAMLGNYVVNVLTANLGVTIKQAASYEAAGIYLSQRALGKLLPEALGRVGRFADTVWHFDKICKEIDKYTGLHYMRRIGLSTPEISMMKKTGWRNKLPGMKWIQYVDCVTTAALWEATKKQVSYDYKKEKKSYSSLYRKYDGITVTNSEYDAMQKPVTLNGGITVIVPNYSEAEIRANCARMQEMKSVADLPVSVLDKTGMKPSELIASYFESIGNAIETKRFGTVKAGRSSVKSEVRHGRTAEKLGTLSAIPDVLEKGTVIFQNKKTEGGADRLVVAAPVTIGEKEYYMGVMLQRDANTQTLYAHNVILKEKSNGASHAILVTDKDAGESATLHITSILQNAANVNSENEYWKRVTELYERVIVDTQPMYDVLHRPEFSKKDNPAHKALHMFRTVPFQNLGILADSVSEFGAATKEAYNAYKNKQSESQKQESKEKFKKATHKLQRVARVTITGIVAFELFTIFSNLVKRKDKKYRDEYGDLTWDSFKEGAIWELASNLAATLFPYSPVNPVDTVKSFTENGPSWDFVSGLPAGEVINDALNGINNVRKAIDEVPEILDDETVDTWGLINKLFGKDSAVFGLAKTLGQATGVPVGNYADIGASIYGWANDIYKGKNPFEGEYTKSQIINKLYDMRMDGDTAGADKAYEEAIHIKNKNGEELGKKGVESEMVKRLADDPTLAELADAYMDYDFTTYDLLFAELSEKGFTDNEISKARDKYRKELLEEETEDDPDEDPEQYKEFPYKDVAQAIKDGKSEYIDRALEYYRAEGVTDDALKSGITRWMKPIYADADENDRKKYQDILNNRFGFNKDKNGKKKEFDFSKWETSYTYNDLYSAVTGGAGDQAHEIFESLAMLKGPGEEGRKKAREELADKLREVYVKMNGTERADMHDFLKKYCGFPSNYNFGAWLNRNYK